MADTQNDGASMPFPRPYERGHEAIINGSETLAQQVLSFALFVGLLGIVFGYTLAVIMMQLSMAYGLPFPPEVSWFCLYVGWVYCGIAGFVNIKEAQNGVPSLFGSYVSWWLAPAGVSWWVPWPFGYVRIGARVHVGEISVPLTFDQIEAADNVQMKASFTMRIRVKYPLTLIRQSPEEAGKALRGLMERTLRWYVSGKKSTDLPAAKGEASKILAGLQNEFNTDAVEGSPSRHVRFSVDDDTADGRTVREIAEDVSYEILEVLLSDFTLPDAIVAAKAEERQAESRNLAVEARVRHRKKMQDENPGVNVSEVEENVLTDAGLARMNIVRGSGGEKPGDFTTGAMIQTNQGGTSPKKQSDEVDKKND